MPKMMKAQIVKAPYEMEYTEVPVPEISDDEVLIKVKVCGICGSDTVFIQENMQKINYL